MNRLDKIWIGILTWIGSFKFKFLMIQINKEKEIVSYLFTTSSDIAITFMEKEKDYTYILEEVGKHDKEDS